MSTPQESRNPAPGEEYNPGPPTPPREAATVILLRGGNSALEVLLVKRNPNARFMGGVWVFPGGALDRGDRDHDGPPASDPAAPHRAAALRELHEEASVSIDDPGSLVEFSRWITPAQITVRFDTRFFLAALPDGQHPAVDGEECVDLGWFTPAAALDAHRRDELALVFPTIKHLEQLGAFASVAELIDFASGRDVAAVEPRVVVDGDTAHVLLPGEPGY
jgi:8-oxo-dGTP pyrophosphatase MutT (NUDIX family)